MHLAELAAETLTQKHRRLMHGIYFPLAGSTFFERVAYEIGWLFGGVAALTADQQRNQKDQRGEQS